MAHGNEMGDMADFLLYPTDDNSMYSFQYSHQSRHANTSNDMVYGNQQSITSDDGTFTGLLNGDNSSIEGLQHSEIGATENRSITANFFSDSSEESTYQSQSYILPTTSAEYHFTATYGIPRTVGPFDPNLSTPGFLIHPPTLPFVPSQSEKSEYRSNTSISPATSVGGFEGHATHSGLNSAIGSNASAPSSVHSSPYIAHEDTWTEKVEDLDIDAGLSDGSGFVDPRILDPSPRESPFEDHTSGANSPIDPPHSPPMSSGPSSPTLARKRSPVSRKSSPSSHHRSAPYPLTRGDSSGSARSSKSPRLDYLDTSGKMRTPSSPTGQTGNGKDSFCTECGRTFRDLRAHQLTHQQERPEKCPIATCEYSKKGFARKYDCQRHTLTHYKGTMVCGFCPGSGSPAEKSFNRADVFKRHLMSVHNVEQTPPNGRKKATPNNTSSSLHPAVSPSKSNEEFEFGLSGKCSTCGVTFATAQQFYEHLDDCVLNKVVQEEPNAAYNEINLDQVKLEEIAESLARTSVRSRRPKQAEEEPEEDEDEELADAEEAEDKSDEKDETWTDGKKRSKPNGLGRTPSARPPSARPKTAAGAGVRRGPASSRFDKNGSIQKPRARKGGKKRKNFPAGWGCQPEQMVTKRRCLMVFDGPTLLCRDEMMMHTEWEVKANTSNGDTFVSDLDFWTLEKAKAAIDAAPSNVEVH